MIPIERVTNLPSPLQKKKNKPYLSNLYLQREIYSIFFYHSQIIKKNSNNLKSNLCPLSLVIKQYAFHCQVTYFGICK